MDKVVFPLEIRMRGEFVENLQDALLQLLQTNRNLFTPAPPFTKVSPSTDWAKVTRSLKQERKKSYYGKTTRALVTSFQRASKLDDTGVVDEQSARLINQILERSLSQTYHVSGYVRQSDNTPLGGISVIAVDWDRGGEDQLGQSVTNENGYYEIGYTAEQFRSSDSERGGADLIVRAVNTDGLLLANSTRINSASADEQVDLVVKVVDQYSKFIVKGTVSRANDSPAAGVPVLAFDKDLRAEQLLGETRTSKTGRYEIHYSADQFRRAEKLSADLQVRVVDEDAKVLSHSKVIYNARPIETVDLSLGANHNPGQSEYDRYVVELMPLLEYLPLSELTDDDLVFLNGETGISPQHLLFIQLDAGWSQRHDIEPAVFYGLLRQDLPTGFSELLSRQQSILREALKNSIARNIVPAALQDNFDDILLRLQELAVESAFDNDDESPAIPIGEILATVPTLTTGQLRDYVRTSLLTENPGDVKPRLLQQGFTEDDLQSIEFSLKSFAFVNGHLPTLGNLQRLRQEKPGLDSGRKLVTISRNRWIRLIKGEGGDSELPDSVPGASQKERIRNFAEQIESNLERSFPTAWIGHRLPGLYRDNRDLRRDLARFFRKNPEFDFGRQRAAQYLGNGADLRGISDVSGVQQVLQTTQRLYQVSGTDEESRYSTIASLIGGGYENATQIAGSSEQAFIADMGASIGDGAARDVYGRAGEVIAGAELLRARLRERLNPIGPIIGPPTIPRPDDADEPGPPELEDIFGALSACACDHCASALSPAAYFVDLLNELSKSESEEDGASILFRRRPDLQHIKLNCANTDHVMPYIDLVNEVLEAAIADGPYDRQTSWDSEDLRVSWEHQNHEVYETIIAGASLPWAPSFEPLHIQQSFLLRHFNIDQTEWFESFGDPGDGGLTRASSCLGISRALAQAVSTAATDRHGLSTSAATFLQQTGLSYEGFLDLLQITWASGGGSTGAMGIDFPDDGSCDLERATITNLDDDRADRIWRLLRLRAALDWPLLELGTVLQVATEISGDADFGQNALLVMADLSHLASRVGWLVTGLAPLFLTSSSEPTLARDRRLELLAETAGVAIAEVHANTVLSAIDANLATPALAISCLDQLELQAQYGLSSAELQWLLQHVDREPPVFAPEDGDLQQFLQELWEGAAVLRDTMPTVPDDVFLGTVTEFATNRLAAYLSTDASQLGLVITNILAILENWQNFLLAVATDFDALPRPIKQQAETDFIRLAKSTRLINAFRLSEDELLSTTVRFDFSSTPAASSDSVLDYRGWFDFAEVVAIRDELPAWSQSLFSLLDQNSAATLSATSGWSQTDIEQMALDLAVPTSYATLALAFRWMRHLGLSMLELTDFIAELQTSDASALITRLMAIGGTRYGRRDWNEIITPANDQIREQKRNVLLAYLTSEAVPGRSTAFTDVNEIYAYFLIDPEMSSCRMTSRIKNALSTVQLFVQRARMNLEAPAITRETLGAAFNQEWEWRKNYRVWEANRKVFLYPENYIFPELRDDQTVFFKEFVNSLLQDELREDTVERAATAYLEKLRDVARLDMRALCQSDSGEVHVLARSYSETHHYFYRKRDVLGFWQGWEPVEIDVRGDHHLIVEHAGRLYLVWLTFQPYSDGAQRSSSDDAEPLQWELKLHWSVRGDTNWNIVNASSMQNRLIIGSGSQPDDFTLRVSTDEDALGVDIYTFHRSSESTALAAHVPMAGFGLNSCIGDFRLQDSNGTSPLLFPSLTFPAGVKYVEQTTEDEAGRSYPLHMPSVDIEDYDFNQLDSGLSDRLTGLAKVIFLILEALVDGARNLEAARSARREIPLLEITPGQFRLLPPLQHAQFSSDSPFFFEDDNRTYLAQRQDEEIHLEVPVFSGVPGGLGITPVSTSLSFLQTTFRFDLFYHPYVCGLLTRLHQGGFNKMYGDGYLKAVEWRELGSEFESFEERYRPYGVVLDTSLLDETLQYSSDGSYSIYNWELFFHIPLHLAQLLTQAGKFESAQKWLHRIFDPTVTPEEAVSFLDPKRARSWRIFPFYSDSLSAPETIAEMLEQLNRGDTTLMDDVNAWRADPFNPHLLARMRISAYMRKTVLQYLDNLIQWGDQLFARHTIESVGEASQIYILAKEILGKRPVQISGQRPEIEMSFQELTEPGGPGLGAFSNAWIEDYVGEAGAGSAAGATAGASLVNTLFFCVPGNHELLKYWDTVDDRLFKIHHCLDVAGKARSLPLFEPPIDPALLVRARAAGLDIGTVLDDLSGVNAPHYRYQLSFQKALELCNELRGFGGSVLSALEKKDAEQLARIRAVNEVELLELRNAIIERQIEEAKLQLEALEKSKANAEIRAEYYRSRKFISIGEGIAQGLDFAAVGLETAAAATRSTASVLQALPRVHAQGVASGASSSPKDVGDATMSASEVLTSLSRIVAYGSRQTSTLAAYERRKDDWNFQRDLADVDIEQIEKQILAAEIRIAIAENEKRNLKVQIKQSREVSDFLRDKFTNQALYTWMSGQLMALHRQIYELALSMAKQAQRSAERELGLAVGDIQHVQPGHWDSQHKGLLAGERLWLQLRRLDSEFIQRNARKFELTKSISLARLDPMALFALKQSGACTISIPEWLYDLDFPGHSNRRIKNVRLTVPAVSGPFTSLAMELSLTSSEVDGTSEPLAAGESIATSSGQNDAGLFELNFRDERYLPFEGAGAVSDWALSMPGIAQFDPDTISDVIMQVSYTSLPPALVSDIPARPDLIRDASLFSVLSVRSQFPVAWELLQRHAETGTGTLEVEISSEHLPYGASSATEVTVQKVALATPGGSAPEPPTTETLSGIGPWSLSLTISQPELLRDIYLLVQSGFNG